MRLFMGLDVGTSAVKGVTITEEGRIIAEAKRNVTFAKPQPGRFEIDPEDHYRSIIGVISEMVTATRGSGKTAAVSMAAASGNTLLLDTQNKPLTPIISWLDQRGMGKDDELFPGFDFSHLHDIIGWPWVGMFPLAHLQWIKKNLPDTFERAGRVAMNLDYLSFRLTGNWMIDSSNATTFYLQDQKQRQWHKPYLDYVGITEEQLPRIAEPGTSAGTITPAAAADTGLPEDAQLVLGAFDHPCAARGTGNLEEGNVLLSCGTSWVGFYPVYDREKAVAMKLLIDPFLSPHGPWGAMFSIPAIAVNIDWYIDTFIASEANKYDRFNALASEARPGAGGLSINPLIDPTGDDEASREQVERVRQSSATNIARAVMEGAVFEMKKWIDKLDVEGFTAETITMVGGPSESPVWPQILSDATGLELRLINGQTAGAYGAALLGAIGTGVFPGEEEAFSSLSGKPRIIYPQEALFKQYQGLYNDKT